jgi:NADH-quinone oxidoreductase subunit B
MEERSTGVGIEQKLPPLVVTNLEKVVSLCRANSIWPMTFGLACCAIEMMVASSADYDIARFGAEAFRPSPRQSDLLIVAGTVTTKMAPLVERIYLQIAEPKWVIAYGSCACSGGIFNTYATVQGVDKFLPVDVYIPGCPPRPEALLAGIMKLQAKIKQEKFSDRPDLPLISAGS